ncbi:unnamed protein product [Danaus chrysippus]|uniref:(African queen) hypothetical protein n=1 Tax=Danaus chrysippus TaxID=151541 RepID=A0A8J2QRB2_9NEOP|nr:unnamed protein product [Danaus chrysippus]
MGLMASDGLVLIRRGGSSALIQQAVRDATFLDDDSPSLPPRNGQLFFPCNRMSRVALVTGCICLIRSIALSRPEHWARFAAEYLGRVTDKKVTRQTEPAKVGADVGSTTTPSQLSQECLTNTNNERRAHERRPRRLLRANGLWRENTLLRIRTERP